MSRHHTTNVLDHPVALADNFTRLRGALDWGIDHDIGHSRASIAVNLTRHDLYDIEDDASLSVASSTTVPFTDWVEMRGTLSAALSNDGDEFTTTSGFLAAKTRLAILTAGLQAGIRINPSTTLVLDAAGTAEEAGRTRFPGSSQVSLPLEADRRRFAISATAMRTQGELSYGIHTGLHLVRAEMAALLPAIALVQYTLKLQAAASSQEGHRLAMAAGVQMIDVREPAFRQLRPTLEAAASIPLGNRLLMLANLSASYDTVSRDDPVGAFVRKAEAALSLTATERLRIVAGIRGERRDNIGLGGMQAIRAAFAEARWSLNEHWAATIRVDTSRKLETLTGAVTRAMEAQVALTTSL